MTIGGPFMTSAFWWVLALWISGPVHGGGQTVGPEWPESWTREGVLSALERVMPSRGTLRLEYGVTDPDAVAGQKDVVVVDWGDGSWALARTPPNSALGRGPDGVVYNGKPWEGGLRRTESASSGIDSFVDAYLPLWMLRGMLRVERGFERAGPVDDGGFEVTFVFPRGSREFRVDELPVAEVERWGGVERVMRRVKVRVSADWRVTRVEVEGRAPEDVVTAGESRPGVQIAAKAIGLSSGLRGVTFDPVAPGGVTMALAEREAEGLWPRAASRVPVPKAGESEPPVPIRGARGGGAGLANVDGTSVALAGAVMIVVGMIVWYRWRGRGVG